MNYFDWAMASIAAIVSLPNRSGLGSAIFNDPFNSPNWDRLNRCGNTFFFGLNKNCLESSGA